VVERTVGSDDLVHIEARADLRAAGALWACTIVAALGLPPLWGFWARLWLFDSVLALVPWSMALLLATHALLLFALFAPLARFWSLAALDAPTPLRLRSPLLAGALVALLLLTLGLAPQLWWQAWLRRIPFAPLTLPFVERLQFSLLALVVFAGALGWLAWQRPWARASQRDPDSEPVVLAPETLGTALGPIAGLGRPALLVQLLYQGLAALSSVMRLVLAPFEQRYYLLAVLVTLICVMLLMAL
jgi:hypothetical protein